MSDDDNITHEPVSPGWLMASPRHRLLALVGGSIGISLLLVVISMTIYQSGGAAQLDLSRPGYEAVQKQANKSNEFEEFSGTGKIDKATLAEFKSLYASQAERVTRVDAFDPTVLDTRALGLELSEPVQE